MQNQIHIFMRRYYKLIGRHGEWSKHLRKWGKKQSNKRIRKIKYNFTSRETY